MTLLAVASGPNGRKVGLKTNVGQTKFVVLVQGQHAGPALILLGSTRPTDHSCVPGTWDRWSAQMRKGVTAAKVSEFSSQTILKVNVNPVRS